MTTSSTDAGASPLRRYVSSGRTPLSGLILGLLTGFLVALVLGALYATAIVHVPQLLGRVMLGIFFGVAIGFVTTSVMRAFHVRSSALVIASVLALAVVGWLVSWLAWIPQVYSDVRLLHLLNPIVLIECVLQVYDEGTWGVGRHATEALRGPPLALVWCAEAAFIIGFPLFVAFGRTSEKVYCEDCGAWCQVVPEAKVFDESAFDTLKSALFERGDLGAIDQLPMPFSRKQ